MTNGENEIANLKQFSILSQENQLVPIQINVAHNTWSPLHTVAIYFRWNEDDEWYVRVYLALFICIRFNVCAYDVLWMFLFSARFTSIRFGEM